MKKYKGSHESFPTFAALESWLNKPVKGKYEPTLLTEKPKWPIPGRYIKRMRMWGYPTTKLLQR